MKKLFAAMALAFVLGTANQASAQFLCRDIGFNGAFPQHPTFYQCREEAYISDVSAWYNK